MSVIAHLELLRERELDRLAALIQRAFRTWQHRNPSPRPKSDRFLLAQTRIAAYWRMYLQRRKYSRMRHAVVTIQAGFRGYQSRCLSQKLLRSKAGKKIKAFMLLYMKCSYLLHRARVLPSESPVDRSWPRVPCQRLFSIADDQIRDIFHRWRCMRYRAKMDQQEYFRLREKLTASILFKDKKAGYEITVSHPFRGDYIRIRQNPKWRKIAAESCDEYVVFADMIAKVHRANGKVTASLVVLSTIGIVVLDSRSLQLKQRAPVTAVTRVSLSPYCDTVAAIHLRDASLSKNRGDFLLECRHIIEFVAKLYLVIQNATGKPPPVDISSNIWIECEDEPLELVFRPTPDDDSGVWNTGCFLGSGGGKHATGGHREGAATVVKSSPSSPLLMGCYADANEVDHPDGRGDGVSPPGSPTMGIGESTKAQGATQPNIRYTRKGGRLEVHY